MIESLGEKANIDDVYLQTILKIIGIAYIAELGASITRDAGLGSVAAKIELSGKIFILVLAATRSEEHTSELQSRGHLVCRLLLEKKKKRNKKNKENAGCQTSRNYF